MGADVWILLALLGGFGMIVTIIGLSGITIYWGRPSLGASRVPMSRRSLLCFILAAWAMLGFVVSGVAQSAWTLFFSLGFFAALCATAASAVLDHRAHRDDP